MTIGTICMGISEFETCFIQTQCCFNLVKASCSDVANGLFRKLASCHEQTIDVELYCWIKPSSVGNLANVKMLQMIGNKIFACHTCHLD